MIDVPEVNPCWRRLLKSEALLISGLVFWASCGGDHTPVEPTDRDGVETIRVGPEGGTLVFEGGQVQMFFPPGAVSTEITVDVKRVSSFPSRPGLLGNSVYRFQPEGVHFSQPVQLILAYDPVAVPPDVFESSLRLFRLAGGGWEEVPESRADPAEDAVTGYLSGFSLIGVKGTVGCWDGSIGSRFAWPVLESSVTQSYGRHGAVVAGKYHAGTDIVEAGARGYLYTACVRATWPGRVENIFGINTQEQNLRRWNRGSDNFFWEPAPTQGRSNHGLGQTVILYHPDLDLYTLYGHLDAVTAGLSVGQHVDAGEVIGRMGNSHQQYLRRCPLSRGDCPRPADAGPGVTTVDDAGFGPHVHLEIKDRGVLSSGLDDDCRVAVGCWWGYTPRGRTGGPETPNTPGHPNWFGYHNPALFLNLSVEALDSPLSIEVEELPLVVWDYPSLGPDLGTRLTSIAAPRQQDIRPAFVAVRRVRDQWYQIYLPNEGSEGWSASGWIAGSLTGTNYSRANVGLSSIGVASSAAPVRATPNRGSETMAFVYGEASGVQQRFVPHEFAEDAYRVHLSEKGLEPVGWIDANDIELPRLFVESVSIDPISGANVPPSDLFTVEVGAGGRDRLIGRLRTQAGFEPIITDLAMSPGRQLWGVSFERLYTVDTATATVTDVGLVGPRGVNALAFDTEGNLFGATVGGELLRIDVSTGSSSTVGSLRSGQSTLFSSGDLVFTPDGRLLGSLTTEAGLPVLAEIEPTTGEVLLISAPEGIGFERVWGMAFVGRQLFGLTTDGIDRGGLITLNLETGQGMLVRSLEFSAGGAGATQGQSSRSRSGGNP